MKKYLYALIVSCAAFVTQAQDSIVHRVILIGDAGEISKEQQRIIPLAAEMVIKNKTSVLYLGDNIYPSGMALPGNKKEQATQDILRSQYSPMRSNGAAVYFVPGNHDWDRMGPDGLAKIKNQWSYLNQQNDPLLKMVPADGCPDPVEINVADNLTIIAFDSEWWLFPYDKDNKEADCNCRTKEDITARLQELLYKNRYKMVMLASHHPFQSYGHHGGYYSLKDHIFPLTAINKDLYIPLPVIGSLYPVLRKAIVNPEDMGHPLYKTMIKNMDEVAQHFPNLIHVAGHEHGLQFIKSSQVQVVSGAGAKKAYARKGKHSLFASTRAGFITADLLTNNHLRFTYYTQITDGVKASFTYTQEYVKVQEQEQLAIKATPQDSITIVPLARFDSVNRFHRWLFGENYRKDYATPTTFPVIRISQVKGGLTPSRLGGGHQSKSLRLLDKNGKEWALRSVEKYPDVLLPEALRETFVKDLLSDNMSSNYPYGALIVPPIASRLGIPHATPIIGWVAPDTALGIYGNTFANTLCLLEEREPLGESDNTLKMRRKMDEDNDNSFDSTAYLRARLLDLLIGDWDRHEDQWRWLPEKDGKGKKYKAIPRDRDQVFYTNQGVIPHAARWRWILPFLQGFNSNYRNIEGELWESRQLNGRFLTQFSYDDWMRITREFVATVTDPVLEEGLRQLPAAAYQLRHDKFLKILKDRRDNLPAAMDHYYRFINKIVDIKVTDKHELVEITDAPDNGITVAIHKLSKSRKLEDLLFKKTFSPGMTKEVRLYLSKGDDSVRINNTNNGVKLRIIGGEGNKTYDVAEGKGGIKLYEGENNATINGDAGRLRKRLSNDSAHTAFNPVDLYNITQPLASIGLNVDDGFLLGAGFKHVRKQGFRKKPYTKIAQYSGLQQLLVSHSFSTNAYKIDYKGEWIHAIGKADIITQALIKAPNNTINFFGRGNETEFHKIDNFKKFYRTRFNTYQAWAALRWGNAKGSSISVGPAAQIYRFDDDGNKGRFIENTSLIGSYDSATIADDKAHAGLIVNYIRDKRNNPILTSWGSYINVRLQGFGGLNDYSKSFAQLIPEIAFYTPLNAKSSIVLANRLGGGITVGKTAFYQSLFLGGHENLLGYRQYRFAGQHSLYNNLEMRIKLTQIGGYVLPGLFGMIGFYDVGRVWEKGEHSDKWHNGVGGGFFFAPAQMIVIRALAGYSSEGWLPFVVVGMRF
ncbi:BamA/TamA family outer membrane protein [Pseudoflavitalea sp. X16]|uniref:BamA/TamA family outer membrane protein n=1 Tax=Paraflavitalea devenefica TaxID=2716334 RepID=UPI00141D846A|nr:BamA/TamA family outer membrane protein [Paraflavitalea devenefica]NII23814.1 BamA/TamA family outer membrane protein [Paraflavitalea devenefica]